MRRRIDDRPGRARDTAPPPRRAFSVQPVEARWTPPGKRHVLVLIGHPMAFEILRLLRDQIERKLTNAIVAEYCITDPERCTMEVQIDEADPMTSEQFIGEIRRLLDLVR